MRHIWTDDELYTVYLEETAKTAAKAAKANANYVKPIMLSKEQVLDALKDKIDLIKRAGGRASGKNKLVAKLAHDYATPMSNDQTNKLTELFGKLGVKGPGKSKLKFMTYRDALRATGLDDKIKQLYDEARANGVSSDDAKHMISVQIFGSN